MTEEAESSTQVYSGDIWSGGFGFAFANSVHDILDRETFAFTDLLDEDEFLQEVKGLDPKLIEYLCRKETIQELLGYLSSPIPLDCTDQRRFKYPYLSCEILCCEVRDILSVLSTSPQHIDQFFSFLDQSHDGIDERLSGYFEKTFAVLYKHFRNTLIEKVNEGGITLFKKFLNHISSFSVMQVARTLFLPRLPSFMGNDFQSNNSTNNYQPEENAVQICYWTQDVQVLNILVGMLAIPSSEASETEKTIDNDNEDEHLNSDDDSDDDDDDTVSHVAELMLFIVSQSVADSPVLTSMYSESVLSTLQSTCTAYRPFTKKALKSKINFESYALSCLRILEALVLRLSPRPMQMEDNEFYVNYSEDFGPPNVDKSIMDDCVVQLMPWICQCLQDNGEMIVSSCGNCTPRVGPMRVQMARFVRALVGIHSSRIDAVLRNSGTMTCMIDAFFRHEHCSILHQEVSEAIVGAFEGHTLERITLQKSLFQESMFLERIKEAVCLNIANEAQGLRRKGYIGHLFQISKALENTATPPDNKSPENNDDSYHDSSLNRVTLWECISSDPCKDWWDSFVETILCREMDIMTKPIGNFPVPVRDTSAPLSNNDFDDGSFDLAAVFEEKDSQINLTGLHREEHGKGDFANMAGWANFADFGTNQNSDGFADFDSSFSSLEPTDNTFDSSFDRINMSQIDSPSSPSVLYRDSPFSHPPNERAPSPFVLHSNSDSNSAIREQKEISLCKDEKKKLTSADQNDEN